MIIPTVSLMGPMVMIISAIVFRINFQCSSQRHFLKEKSRPRPLGPSNNVYSLTCELASLHLSDEALQGHGCQMDPEGEGKEADAAFVEDDSLCHPFSWIWSKKSRDVASNDFGARISTKLWNEAYLWKRSYNNKSTNENTNDRVCWISSPSLWKLAIIIAVTTTLTSERGRTSQGRVWGKKVCDSFVEISRCASSFVATIDFIH